MTDSETPHDFELVELLLQFIHRHSEAKIALCKDVPMTDAPPILLCAYDEGDEYSIGYIPLVEPDGKGNWVQDDVIKAVLDSAKNIPVREFKYIISCVEAYGIEKPYDEVRNIDIQADFENNPFSEVTRNITLVALNWQADQVMACTVPYEYNDKGLPEIKNLNWFDFPVSDTEESGFSEMVDALFTTTGIIRRQVRELED
jgi:hypothetical protein